MRPIEQQMVVIFSFNRKKFRLLVVVGQILILLLVLAVLGIRSVRTFSRVVWDRRKHLIELVRGCHQYFLKFGVLYFQLAFS